MPIAPPVSYPGVYIQEVESPVHTITPAPTSVTAFIGRALRGPTDQDGPMLIHSFSDFVRIYGGLWKDSELGYAVNDFFLNGGSDAVIVRLWRSQGTDKAFITLSPGGIVLKAKYPGSWGNQLKVRVEQFDLAKDKAPAQAVADQLSTFTTVKPEQVFTLVVHDGGANITETFANVTLLDSPNRLDRVLAEQSQLVFYGGTDISTERMPTPHPMATADPPTKLPQTIWEDPMANTAVSNPRADDGAPLDADAFINAGDKLGIYALDHADIFNLLVIPPYAEDDSLYTEVLSQAIAYCERRRAIFLVDPPPAWTNKDVAKQPIAGLSLSANAAQYFPRIKKADVLRNGQVREFAPSGSIAGVIARTDLRRGVWKAPAGLEATISGIMGLSVQLTDLENGELNPLGINCLRTMPAAGTVIWGARTIWAWNCSQDAAS